MSLKALISLLFIILIGQCQGRNCLIWFTDVLMQLAVTVVIMQET